GRGRTGVRVAAAEAVGERVHREAGTVHPGLEPGLHTGHPPRPLAVPAGHHVPVEVVDGEALRVRRTGADVGDDVPGGRAGGGAEPDVPGGTGDGHRGLPGTDRLDGTGVVEPDHQLGAVVL